MMALILAGGKGARLRPYTITVPKPMLPLGDMPILEVVIRQLAAAGITRIVLTLGHMAHLFKAALGDGERWGVRIDYNFEDKPLGTAGPIRCVSDLEEDFLVMNGDILTTISYADLFAAHRSKGALGTISVHERSVQIDYGVLTSEGGLLKDYVEKPTFSYHVSMGVNILSRGCLEYIPVDQPFDMPSLMMAMKRAGRTVACYETDAYWQDIGRFDDYQRASDDFSANPGRFLPGS